MNAKTLKALKGSIAKWERIVAGTGACHGVDNCPLCELFWDRGCRGCPVVQKSGYRLCIGTPFEGVGRHLSDEGFARTTSAKKAARAELAFLKSLLPKRKRK